MLHNGGTVSTTFEGIVEQALTQLEQEQQALAQQVSAEATSFEINIIEATLSALSTQIDGIQSNLFSFETTVLDLLGRTYAEALQVKNGGFEGEQDRKSTRLNSSHQIISYAVF